MAYRLDPELVERRARLLDAPPTLATKRRLAIVDDLIAGRSPARHVELRTPCAEDWDAMAGGDQLRRRLRCDRDVHDLDRMAPRDITELFARRIGRLRPVLPTGRSSRGRALPSPTAPVGARRDRHRGAGDHSCRRHVARARRASGGDRRKRTRCTDRSRAVPRFGGLGDGDDAADPGARVKWGSQGSGPAHTELARMVRASSVAKR